MQPPFKMILETDIEKWRYETFWDKEPETIAWIDDMQPGEVLYDVGANIGIYTLYAASRGVQVVAFEPVLENYVRLVQNIELNGFKNVVPIYAAAGGSPYDDIEICPIAINNHTIGASGAQLGPTMIGEQRSVLVIPLEQVGYMTGLQEDHIKIDVDGIEYYVLMSSYHDAKSYLIEINPPWSAEKARECVGINYTTDNKYNTMTPHSRERRQREGIKAENVVFTRI